MTLDEAIKHCLEVAENNEQFASGEWIGSEGEANRQECLQCAAEHRQLAEWLAELKVLRESSVAEEDYISLKYAFDDAKGLLKLAMEDMNTLYESSKDEGCVGIEFRWRYADEAEKLLGENTNEANT